LQRLEGVQRRELWDPGVAELADVRQRIGGECRQQFFVRRGPRDVLEVDPDAWVRALELGHELCDHFGLAAHRPEADDGLVLATRTTRQQ
jgi:hypothetical protein